MAPAGFGAPEARVNYLLGPDPAGWKTHLPAYSKIVYRDLFEGIDLFFYNGGPQLEYDFVARPFADLEQIRIELQGRAAAALDEKGDLVLPMNSGPLKMHRPRAYQRKASGSVNVPCRFNQVAPGVFGFSVGPYDRRLPLVIDPVMDYSSFLGGASDDQITAAALDDEGNTYLTGTTESLDLPVSGGALQGSKGGGRDIFISKLAPDGQSLIYSTYLGGAGDDQSSALVVRPGGNVVLAGQTSTRDFPVTSQAVQDSYGGGTTDAFIAELSEFGSKLIFSTLLGGSRDEELRALALDGAGNVYAGGFTRSSNFPTANALQADSAGGSTEAVIAKLNSSGTELLFSTYLGGSRSEVVNGIGVGPQGNIAVTGSTDSDDFPLQDALQGGRSGSDEGFVARLSGDGSQLLFSSYLGGRGSDIARALKVDSKGNAVVVGWTSSTDFPVKDAVQPQNAGLTDMFIARLKADNSGYDYVTYLGGAFNDLCQAVAVGPTGTVYAAGSSSSPDFPAVGTIFAKQPGNESVFVKLNSFGSSLLQTTFLGGKGNESASAIALSSSGAVVLAGTTDSVDFPTLMPFQAQLKSVGLFHTSDKGGTWSASNSGLDDPNVQALTLAPSAPSVLYAGTGARGVFKSTDGGATWSQSGLTNLPIFSIAVDPKDPDTAFAGVSGTIFKTSDGGENWEVKNKGLPFNAAFWKLAFDPQDSLTLYVGTNGAGIFKTDDAGETWRAINNGLDGNSKQIFAVAVDPNDSSRVYIGTLGAVFTSDNGGATWSQTSFKDVGAVQAVLVSPSSNVYASGSAFNGIVGKSVDHGENWNAQPVLDSNGKTGGAITSLAVNPSNEDEIYAGTFAGGVFKGTKVFEPQGSQNWTIVNAGLNNLKVLSLLLNPQQPSSLFAIFSGGSDSFLTRLQDTEVFYFPQIADGQAGRLKFQTTLILLNNGEETTAKVEFFDNDGNPLEVPLGALGTSSVFEIPLQPGQAFSAQTLGAEGGIHSGYARISTSGEVGGIAIFTRTDTANGKVLFETGVPASKALTRFAFFLDSLGTKDTGLAIVDTAQKKSNPGEKATVTVRLFDADLNPIDEKEIKLAPGEHIAKFENEFFDEIAAQVSEMQGLITVESDQPIAAVTLRQRDDPTLQFPQEVATLAAFPIIPTNNLSKVIYFPQIADGNFDIQGSTFQTRSTIILANPGLTTALVTVEFFDDSGAPLEVSLGKLGKQFKFQFQLRPGEFRFEQTSGEGDLQVGYARVTSSTLAVGGTAVFTQADVKNNTATTVTETGVAATGTLKKFSIFLDSLGSRDSGLAMVNAGDERAHITFKAYNKDHHLIAAVTDPDPISPSGGKEGGLKPGGHLSRFIFQLFPEDVRQQLQETEGVVTVESTQPLAALTLRQKFDPLKPFPLEIPTLTTFPVIPGIPQE